MFCIKSLRRALIALFIIALPAVSLAQFQKSPASIFTDWPELEVAPTPGDQSQIQIYAIVDKTRVVYTIIDNNRFNSFIWGSFKCDKEFTVLKTSSNNYYDISCIDKDMFDQPVAYVLRYDGRGKYMQSAR